jgi:hypothetical protein
MASARRIEECAISTQYWSTLRSLLHPIDRRERSIHNCRQIIGDVDMHIGTKPLLLGRFAWIVLLVSASVILTGRYACATPFPALAALAALEADQRDGITLVGAIWLVNQIVGFTILGYPQELQAYAWGAVIALSAYGAFFFARQAAVLFARNSSIAISLGAIAAAFFAYELVLYIASFLLPGCDEAFALPIVLRIALLNIGTFGLLLAGHRLAVAGGLLCRNIAESRAAGMPVSSVR